MLRPWETLGSHYHQDGNHMELTLFVIIGAVSVVAAAMMLISENAIHSALFLILNLACIAFFFLMLDAPFLAMVQITVYAGAIMVLFLFVIMLLGAERVEPSRQPRFRWLTPMVIVLTLVFLVTTSVAIIDGKINLTEPQQIQPRVRVVHALEGVPQIDAYLNGAPITQGLAFLENSDFSTHDPGRYTVAVFPAGADPNTASPLVEQAIDLQSGEALSLTAVGRSTPSLVLATEDLSYNEKKDTARITAINALPDRDWVSVFNDTNPDNRRVLIDKLDFGVAANIQVEKGTYTIGLYPNGNDRNSLAEFKDEKLDADVSVLWVFAEERRPDNSFVNVLVPLKTSTNPSFGGPNHVGQLLFSLYVLPFEMVSLLLLVAMIGAIVLTHEVLPVRRKVERRLAVNPSAGVEQPASSEGK
jgi:NADH:ubiquinone oxidoreductase subunit 6 (subunit J)